ncbi:MAG TPA: TIGR00296 family protein [Methanobacteriaceae archaeon]|nr:TIGR00296 family protein [Methanobacteriaceae archaeon]
MLKKEDGEFLLKLARDAIENYILNGQVLEVPEEVPEYLNENRGVFVTLHEKGELRGCIGYPEPVKPLLDALIEVAIGAATGDPRFAPVNSHELDDIHVEVSVLTPPKLIEINKPVEYLDNIKLGEDGLIVENGPFRGLLLPQVPLEWKWDLDEFLANTCMKAGMSPDCWLQEGVKIYSFQSQIFEE